MAKIQDTFASINHPQPRHEKGVVMEDITIGVEGRVRAGGQGQETESGEKTWLWWEHRDQAERRSDKGGERRMGNNGPGEEGMRQMEIGEKWEIDCR